MALIHCSFFSEALKIQTAMYVILPQAMKKVGTAGSPKLKEKHPTLYLLHGFTDDYTAWIRQTAIERYVSEMDLAVVMPAVNLSFYTDMSHGADYWTFVSEELPSIARSFFPLSEKREDNFAAGLSMGGYGALKLGLRCPDKFAAVASLSGAVDIVREVKRTSDNGEAYPRFTDIFGDIGKLEGSENDLLHLAKKLAGPAVQKPAVYQFCGTEDFLYEDNAAFRAFIKDLDFDYTYEEEPGTHVWQLWDKKIRSVLEWLPVAK
jgi:putative tributyrin esterase